MIEFRVKKHIQGWVAEVKSPRWRPWGIKWVWTHYVSVAGIHTEPWYYKSREAAEKGLLRYTKWDMIFNSRYEE